MRNPFKRTKKNKAIANIDKAKGVVSAVAVSEHADSGTAVHPIEGRLLVMGRESAFSAEVIDYAIEMARRMSFEILALNSAPLSCDAFNLFSTSRSKLCQEFQTISERNAVAFQKEAEANGIPFTHVVKFDDPDQALASVQRDYGNIEFVISEAQPAATVDQVAESSRPRNEVLVYSMI